METDDTASFEPTVDDLLRNNLDYASEFAADALQAKPTRQMAIVTCMDSRMNIFSILGLGAGEAHVIRNAGGVVTDDVIRSLCLSQRFLGTREIVLIHHNNCGLQMVTEDGFKNELEAELGIKPAWAVEAFDDPYEDVRQSIKRLELTPFIAHKDFIRGFVYDVTTGLLNEVVA